MATTATVAKFPAMSATRKPGISGKSPSQSSKPQSSHSSSSKPFWDTLHAVRTNEFRHRDDDDDDDPRRRKKPLWTFRSRKSHILDTHGHYVWKRELNCFETQNLPEEVFPDNTLEITLGLSGSENNSNKNNSKSLRIRFGALEGLRGWMSLDSEPIAGAAAETAHWKAVALHQEQQQQLRQQLQQQQRDGSETDGNRRKSAKHPNGGDAAARRAVGGKKLGGGDNDNDAVYLTSYDYAFTTPYKGGTDLVVDDDRTAAPQQQHRYGYLSADSSSFIAKHDAAADPDDDDDVGDETETDADASKKARRASVKLRRPICKCKSDAGRAPLVPSSEPRSAPSKEDRRDTVTTTATTTIAKAESSGITAATTATATTRLPSTSTSVPTAIAPAERTALQDTGNLHHKISAPLPVWHRVRGETKVVDIEGMLSRAAAAAARSSASSPFRFREDVDLWEDDMHDTGVSWLKVRCFVCDEGWACLLRNFVRVDGVLCRVIDTRYVHTFGTDRVYREHSWREGPWEPLVRKVAQLQQQQHHHHHHHQQQQQQQHHHHHPPYPGTRARPGPPAAGRPFPSPSSHGSFPVRVTAINDSVAARCLPLLKPPVTEYLSLEGRAPSPSQLQQKTRRQLAVIRDATIEDGIPVPHPAVEASLGVSFVLKRSGGRTLEAISSAAAAAGNSDVEREADAARASLPIASLWRRDYRGGDAGHDRHRAGSAPGAAILSVAISPDPADGGRLALGDDRGWVEVWRLSTGAPVGRFPVAPASIRTRSEKNPLFQSAKLWVDHLAWSADGSRVGASAGRTTVLASRRVDGDDDEEGWAVRSTLDSAAGTVTGIAFRRLEAGSALAVASRGEVNWLTAPSEDRADPASGAPPALKREGSAIECLDVSPDGTRVAVGFLDKTLRVYTLSDDDDDATTTRTKTSAVDWVGFGSPVKAVSFSPDGSWLAAAGGNALLVLPEDLDPRTEPPVVCRTPGRTGTDGAYGTCRRFGADLRWSSSSSPESRGGGGWLLAALDATDGSVRVFRLPSRDDDVDEDNAVVDCNLLEGWPVRAFPVATVSSPAPSSASSFASTTRFAFSSSEAVTTASDGGTTDPAFLVLDRGDEEGDGDERFSFRRVAPS